MYILCNTAYFSLAQYYCVDMAVMNVDGFDCRNNGGMYNFCGEGMCPKPCDTCEAGVTYMSGCSGLNEGTCVTCKLCGPGYTYMGGCYTDYFWGISSDSVCVPCEAGDFSDENQNFDCKYCPEGTYSGMQASECTPCEAGTFAAYMRMGYCEPCAEGTYQPNTGAIGCLPCESCLSGYYRTGCGGASAGTCTICTNVI